jgi:hypothetical protein
MLKRKKGTFLEEKIKVIACSFFKNLGSYEKRVRGC